MTIAPRVQQPAAPGTASRKMVVCLPVMAGDSGARLAHNGALRGPRPCRPIHSVPRHPDRAGRRRAPVRPLPTPTAATPTAHRPGVSA